MRLAKRKQSLLFLNFLGNNTETAFCAVKMYNTRAIVIRAALLGVSQKRIQTHYDMHWDISITGIAPQQDYLLFLFLVFAM